MRNKQINSPIGRIGHWMVTLKVIFRSYRYIRLGIFNLIMSYKLDVLDERLGGSNYDPVIWEDVEPIQQKLDGAVDLFTDFVELFLDDPKYGEAAKNLISSLQELRS